MAQRRIDVHFHYLPDFYREALVAAGHTRPDGIAGIPAWSEQEMLATMDQLSIERAYLSISSPGVHFGDDAAARDLARRLNEEAARLKIAHPGRIGYFACTPLPDVKGAIAEVRHAFDTLDADGVVFETNFQGVYLGDDRLAPLYEEMDRRSAVLFLHPTSPGSRCSCVDNGGTPTFGYPGPMIEFLFDTTRTVTNMVLSGALQRHPNIRVIVPHAGAALPVLAARIDLVGPMLTPPDAPKPPSMREALSKLHFDLAGTPIPEQLAALLSVADPRRIHYGSDWPFTPRAVCERLARALDDAPSLSGEFGARVMRGNAEQLFARDANAPAACSAL